MKPSDKPVNPSEKPVYPTWRAIAARARNGIIGREGKLPWHIPGDLKFFREATLGGTIIMGRKTFEGIGRPLPRRTNVILTRQAASLQDCWKGVTVLPDFEAIAEADLPSPLWIAGGTEVYRQALPQCAELWLTEVNLEPVGDATFPPFEDLFERVEKLHTEAAFEVWRWVRKRG